MSLRAYGASGPVSAISPPAVSAPFAVTLPAALEEVRASGHVAIPIRAFLCEPRRFTPPWAPAAYARILARSLGAVAWIPEGVPVPDDALDALARLEAAGFPIVHGAAAAVAAARAAEAPVAAAMAAAGLVGSPCPRLVLIGEYDPYDRGWPLYSSSGAWLLHALRSLGYDELTVTLGNACDRSEKPNGPLADAAAHLAHAGPTWVTLGAIADATLRRMGLPHLAAVHPAWHRRFRHEEGSAGYGDRLAADGVPRAGPERWPAESDLVPLPPPLNLPPTMARRAPSGAKRGTLRADRAERARRAYVTGEARTLRDAAALIGASSRVVWEVAERERWEDERSKYAATVREKLYRNSAAEEAKRIGDARRLAWAGATLALGRVVKRLQADEYPARAGDAEALTRTALALSGAEPPGATDPEVERLRGLPLPDLLAESLRNLREQFGEAVVGAVVARSVAPPLAAPEVGSDGASLLPGGLGEAAGGAAIEA